MADLLELRYDMLVIHALREEMVKLIGIDAGPHLYTIAQSFLPDPNELDARYDSAVTAIAGFNPILGFQLRSRDFIRTYLATLSTVAARDQQAAAAWSSLEPVLVPEIQGGLEKAVREKVLPICPCRCSCGSGSRVGPDIAENLSTSLHHRLAKAR